MRVFIAVAILGAASAGSAVGQAGPQTSRDASRATVPPSLIKEVKPEYPAEALAAGYSGTVTLECVVNTDGSVGDVRVLTPVEPSLDAEAVKALKQWQFKPGTKDGTPVPVAVTIEISFTSRPKGPRLGSPEVFLPGGDVTTPKVVTDVKPFFRPDAVRERVTGSVTVECVVLPDGTVGDARVATPVHPQLDAEALRAARQWRFEPGTKNGQPVPVQVTIEMTFRTK
jgi:TonB family protein